VFYLQLIHPDFEKRKVFIDFMIIQRNRSIDANILGDKLLNITYNLPSIC
jgi:hypothetical protein